MGFMQAWEAWSQKLYDTKAKFFQSKYDKIRDTKTPEWYLSLTDGIWEKLSDATKEYLNNIAIETAKKYGDAFAKELLEFIMKKLGLKTA